MRFDKATIKNKIIKIPGKIPTPEIEGSKYK